jgi:signal peptidase I
MTLPQSPTCIAMLSTFALRQWRQWRGYILFFCLIWIPLRATVIDYNPVPTGSMNPTILEGDVVWVDKLAYSLRVPLTQKHIMRWGEPERGDIIVLISPVDGTRLVKRVIGIPGDEIALHHNRLILNGVPLSYTPPTADYRSTIAEIYRPHSAFAEEALPGHLHPIMGLPRVSNEHRNFDSITVPNDRFFIMGDSRDNSIDSRAWGFAPRDAILGQAKGIVVSLDINDTYLPRWNRWGSKLR